MAEEQPIELNEYGVPKDVMWKPGHDINGKRNEMWPIRFYEFQQAVEKEALGDEFESASGERRTEVRKENYGDRVLCWKDHTRKEPKLNHEIKEQFSKMITGEFFCDMNHVYFTEPTDRMAVFMAYNEHFELP